MNRKSSIMMQLSVPETIKEEDETSKLEMSRLGDESA